MMRRVGLAVAMIPLLAACAVSSHSGTPVSPTRDGIPERCRGLAPTAAAHPEPSSEARIKTVLAAYSVLAWNPSAPPVRPSTLSGGLFVNYRPSWDGSRDVAGNTNVRTSGDSDAQAGGSPRHDPLTDLTMLRTIDTVLGIGGSSDSDLDRLRCQLQPVTEAEFANYGVERGWVYGQLIDLSRLDPAGPWLVDARTFANTLARRFRAGLDAMPSFRPDWIAESAAALTDAGSRFQQPSWTKIGRTLALRLCVLSADRATGLFPGQAHSSGGDRATVDDPLVKIGSQAQLLDALLSVYDAEHDRPLLSAVRTAVASIRSPTIGLADTVHGGWYYAVDMDGKGLRTSYKETRQAWLLSMFRHAAAAGLVSSQLIGPMTATIRDSLYQPDSHGYVYRVRPDWTPFAATQNGKRIEENWLSSEATGIALQALLGPLS